MIWPCCSFSFQTKISTEIRKSLQRTHLRYSINCYANATKLLFKCKCCNSRSTLPVQKVTANVCEPYFIGWPRHGVTTRHGLFDTNGIGTVLNPVTVDPTGVSNVHRSKTTLEHVILEHVILCQHLSLQDHFHLSSSQLEQRVNKFMFTSSVYHSWLAALEQYFNSWQMTCDLRQNLTVVSLD